MDVFDRCAIFQGPEDQGRSRRLRQQPCRTAAPAELRWRHRGHRRLCPRSTDPLPSKLWGLFKNYRKLGLGTALILGDRHRPGYQQREVEVMGPDEHEVR